MLGVRNARSSELKPAAPRGRWTILKRANLTTVFTTARPGDLAEKAFAAIYYACAITTW